MSAKENCFSISTGDSFRAGSGRMSVFCRKRSEITDKLMERVTFCSTSARRHFRTRPKHACTNVKLFFARKICFIESCANFRSLKLMKLKNPLAEAFSEMKQNF